MSIETARTSSAQHQVQISQPMAQSTTNPPSSRNISNFPPELLLEIFDRVCAPPKSLATLPRIGSRHLGPLWLGKICRLWREIAWASPMLWTYIHLVPSTDQNDVQVQLLDDYLERSKDLPLTVFFSKRTDNAADYWNNRALPLYELIAGECHRWEVIDIFIPYLCVPHMNATCLYLPRLRTASFEALKSSFPLHLVQNASQVRDLALTTFVLPALETPFRHLTHFSASKLNSTEVLNVLQITPNLRSCFIDEMHRPWPGAFPDPKHIHLENLESLVIRHSLSRSAQDGLFPYILSAPALQKFSYNTRPEGQLPLGLINGLIDASQCRLESLELGTSRLGRSDIGTHLSRLLRCTTTISRLVLHFKTSITDERLINDIAKILNPLSLTVPPSRTDPSASFGGGDYPVPLPELQSLELRLPQRGPLLPVLITIKHRWMFGTAASKFSPSVVSSSGKQFAKILSARLPEWGRSEVMLELSDAIQEGLVVDFIPS